MATLGTFIPVSAIIIATCAWSLCVCFIEYGRRNFIIRGLFLAFLGWLFFTFFKAANLADHAAALAASISLVCLLIAESDVRRRLIPNALVAALLALALLPWSEISWMDRALGGALLGGFFLLVRQAYFWTQAKEGLGLGDVKFAVAIGALLGAQIGLLTVAIAAASVAALMIILGQRKPAPFGAGLGVAVIGALFFRGALV